jgi:hypothetical protein
LQEPRQSRPHNLDAVNSHQPPGLFNKRYASSNRSTLISTPLPACRPLRLVRRQSSHGTGKYHPSLLGLVRRLPREIKSGIGLYLVESAFDDDARILRRIRFDGSSTCSGSMTS